MPDELRVLGSPPPRGGPARAEDLPLAVQALAALAAGPEGGPPDALIAGGLAAVILGPALLGEPATAARRTAAMQAAALHSPTGAPLLVGAPAQLGRLCRLPAGHSVLPGPLALAASGRLDLARQAGRALAGQLAALGVAWCLGPDGEDCFTPAVEAALTSGLQDGGVPAGLRLRPPDGADGPAPLVVASLPPGGRGEAAVQALLGGAQLLLVSGAEEAELAARAVVAAAEAGRLPRALLAEAVSRVLACKRQWGLARRPLPDPEAVPHLLARPSDAHLAAAIGGAAVTELCSGAPVPAPVRLEASPATPEPLLAAAIRRWPAGSVSRAGAGPWLSLDGSCHLLLLPPLPGTLPAGRVLAAYDAVPASLQALLEAAAGLAAAPGRLPLPRPASWAGQA